MSGNYRFHMDQKDLLRKLIAAVGNFMQERLANKQQRIQHKERCAERLAAEDGTGGRDEEVRYADQAVLANLDWGIEALEEAIDTSNVETKHARLNYAEKMLQVCAMLDSGQRTAGVPNFYLSAWAHLNLSCLWMLRNSIQSSVLHILEMFSVDPFFSRNDFAPELWREIFLPHMGSIVGWYYEERHRLVMEVIPDSSDLSFTADIDQFFNESLVFSMRPDQVEKLNTLEKNYGESLDESTKMFAKYFKDCMACDSASSKKVSPMLPIAEPPMTPLHEVSGSIPDYVKFGPILPKSAGFSPALKSKSKKATSPVSKNVDNFTTWDSQEEGLLEDKENDYGYELNAASMEFEEEEEEEEDKLHEALFAEDITMARDKEAGSSAQPLTNKTQNCSPVLCPISLRTPPPKGSSPKPVVSSRREPKSLLRLLSSRVSGPSSLSLQPVSPCSSSSADTDVEESENHHLSVSMSSENANIQEQELSPCSSVCGGSPSWVSSPLSEKQTSHSRPPKDFVCPITGLIFNDPVTLETGQTYERKAIQEWLERGNTTCPITRQRLSSNMLPKTNYVLKRLITTWREKYPEIALEISETPKNSFNCLPQRDIKALSPLSRETGFSNRKGTDDYVSLRSRRFMRVAVATSPTSAITQAAVEAIINGLQSHVSCLCTSDNLEDCEAAVLAIAKLWKEAQGDATVHSYLSKPTIVNGFVEILSASVNREVLKKSIYILSELIFADENVGETLTSVDSDFDCLAVLLKNGLAEAAVLIYQLKPAFAQLSAHEFIPSLLQIVLKINEATDDLQLVIEPKEAALALLEQILMGGDENSRFLSALSVISSSGIPHLVKCLERVEGRSSIICILLCCMRADKSCRSLIASRIELSYVLELFHSGDDNIRGTCIEFLSELVRVARRTCRNKILSTIKDEGAFSTMHTFLVYLQMASIELQPRIATLLLQLDLLVEPHQMSIYREESIEALIEALCRKDFPSHQLMAINALLSISGRLTSTGDSYTEVWLLKCAGFDQPYNALKKAEQLQSLGNDLREVPDEEEAEEEEVSSSWEKRVAYVLCNHEKGSIFKALEECFKSNSLEMAKSCLTIASWLTHMLSVLPDTGVRDIACKSLLEEFINVLQSSKNLEEKILATLALRSFINHRAALQELGKYAKCIYRTLQKLKRHSVGVADILKALVNLSSVNATDMWHCAEVAEIDSSSNGEALCLLYLKGRVLSSHSDGTIKVWDAGKRVLKLIKEFREHTKAVTCLYAPSSGDKLYSGSIDKTIRVWAIKPDQIHCIQVHDVKEAVHELTANAKLACFVPQGTGVKLYNWSGAPRPISLNKYVRCMAMTGDRLYCGCSGYSIQEVDLCNSTYSTFYSGTRKLLGKQTINSLHVQDGFLYAGGSSVDGTAGKVFNLSGKAVKGSFPIGFDIQRIAVNNDHIFTVTKGGTIEVWLKEKVVSIASIKTGQAKVTSLVSDADGGMLYVGTSDGKIQIWALD